MRATNLLGIHHITAIAGAPAENLQFYEKVLGLRLVKKTVNFDDPHTYHLYYGDDEGRPGTILTFFPWSGAAKGVNGAGMVTAISFSIAEAAVDHWLERLARQGIATKLEKRFGQDVIRFADPHGLALELVSTDRVAARRTGDRYGIESNFQISGFHSATGVVRESGPTERLLIEQLGFRRTASEGNRIRFALENKKRMGCYYDQVVDPQASQGRQGSGTVHHIAFRTGREEDQHQWRQELALAGYSASAIRDRNYFKSIYFHEPGGVLFEIATDPPGFTVDEPLESLGQALKLPAQYEPMRKEIEMSLPRLMAPEFNHRYIDAGSNDSGLTLVSLHGTGGNESDLLSLADAVAPGAAVISPRGKVD